jgi:signal transduction histidine kinase
MSTGLLPSLASIGRLPFEKRIGRTLELTCAELGAAVGSIWRYNSSSASYSCLARAGREIDDTNAFEYVLPHDRSLMSDIVEDLSKAPSDAVSLDLQAKEIRRRHWAPEVLESLNLVSVTAFPFYNLSLPTPEMRKNMRGMIMYYFREKRSVAKDLVQFLSIVFSDLYGSLYLTRRDDVVEQVIQAFGDEKLSKNSEALLEMLCKTVCVEAAGVEACSIYEWNPFSSGYRLSTTTGLEGSVSTKNLIDRKGSGLIYAIAERGMPVLIEDVNDGARVKAATGGAVDEKLIRQNIEKTAKPLSSLMFIPVRNPISSFDHLPTAVIKFVNKRHHLVNLIDFFDIEDRLIGEEIARMIALYEEQARTIRQQEAFALLFGHEAQAPAVGIRGTADRILYRHERDQLEPKQLASSAQDIFNFAEILIAFAESLIFGFGDRAGSRQLRYKFKQTNLSRCVEAARKVVIPICRAEGIQFDNIRLFGSFPLVFVDNRAFMHIFYNLMTNAIKYRVKERPEEFGIHLTSKRITTFDELSESPEEGLRDIWEEMKKIGYIREAASIIDISDFGIGIAQDESTKVFWQGYRSPSVSMHDIRGSGIGLTIVRNILNDFDSLIWLEHERNPTTFRIMIPDAAESSHFARKDTAKRWQNV